MPLRSPLPLRRGLNRSTDVSPSARLWREAGLLVLATLVAAGSLGLALPPRHAVYCDRLAPLGVLGVLAATLIALCFRALAGARRRAVPGAALLLAAVSLFACAAFLVRYHAVCGQVEQQLRQLKSQH